MRTTARGRSFDPGRPTASPRHRAVYGRYQKIYTAVEFAAAVAFVVGSVCFFSESLMLLATWFFLVGSILFAVRPTVSVLREAHLARIPVPGTDEHEQQHRREPSHAT
ncbi:YrhK family protein [Pseudonocardia sp. RS010]|uniref:YrhK family protein n=1 Tax=Pseudonocardia sp. RS010 TaxID=3385979 RepID=UPI0039A1D134